MHACMHACNTYIHTYIIRHSTYINTLYTYINLSMTYIHTYIHAYVKHRLAHLRVLVQWCGLYSEAVYVDIQHTYQRRRWWRYVRNSSRVNPAGSWRLLSLGFVHCLWTRNNIVPVWTITSNVGTKQVKVLCKLSDNQFYQQRRYFLIF